MNWVSTFCKQTKYVMKTDDDIYVNLPNLMNFLHEKKPNERNIYGCIKNVNGAPQPIAAIPGVTFPTRHPPFTAGAGYVIPGHLIPELMSIAQNIPIIRVEDAFLTGYCASRAGVQRVHSHLFSCGQIVNKNCDLKLAVNGHKISAARMRDVHSELLHGCS